MEINYTEDTAAYDSVLINLLCTKACNYKCDHCMYGCVPQKKVTYMSEEVLSKIYHQVVQPAKELGLDVRVNFVGGEPTLDIDEFRRVWQRVMAWGVTYEMTTNGWWLADKHAFEEVIKIIGYDVEREGTAIRISDSEWHDVWRSESCKRILRKWRDFKEMPIEYYDSDEPAICPHCRDGDIVDADTVDDETNEEYFCKSCKEGVSSTDYYLSREEENFSYGFWDALKQFLEIQEHMYIDNSISELGLQKVSPNGRGAKLGGHQTHTCNVGQEEAILTFNPNGSIQEVCCVGGPTPLGNVDDGVAMLLARRESFIGYIYEKTNAKQVYANKFKYAGGCESGEICVECKSLCSAWKRECKDKVAPLILTTIEE